MNNPVFHAMNPQGYSQNATRVTFEQPNNYYPQKQTPASNPYDDYCRVLHSCNESTQNKILQDEQFQDRYAVCEALIKQALYATIIPDVLQTGDGRIAFEELLATTQRLKEKYAREAADKERETEILTQKLQERDAQFDTLMSRFQQLEEALANSIAPQTAQDTAKPKARAAKPADMQEGA